MKRIQFRRRRRLRRSEHIGRIRWKLWELLQAAGLSIPGPECLWMQEGYYRGPHMDLASWGADWRAVPQGTDRPAFPHMIYSWDTMTRCVKSGITVAKGDGFCEWEIHAKG